MRPLGVTLVGFYQIVRGVTGLVFGLFVVFYKGPAHALASVAAQGNAVERLLSGFGHAAGIVIIGFVVVHMLAGYGVLQMRNWGRFVTLLLSAIELVLVLPGVVHVNIFSLTFGAINAACIFYLAMPPIGRAFHAEGNPMRMAV
jgi:ABC-type glycerol-3-phosphate transport system permease component